MQFFQLSKIPGLQMGGELFHFEPCPVFMQVVALEPSRVNPEKHSYSHTLPSAFPLLQIMSEKNGCGKTSQVPCCGIGSSAICCSRTKKTVD